MMLLVLTSEPVSADQIRSALSADADLEKSEVMVVAPALQTQRRALLDVRHRRGHRQGAGGRAARVASSSSPRASPAKADTGEADPYKAVQDALQTFPADRLLVFSHPDGEQLYREDVDHDELEIRFGLPVDQAELSA